METRVQLILIIGVSLLLNIGKLYVNNGNRSRQVTTVNPDQIIPFMFTFYRSLRAVSPDNIIGDFDEYNE